MAESFSSDKHTKMVNLSASSYKIFDVVVSIIDKKVRDNYVMAVNYEGCRLLIRPLSHIVEIIMVSGLFEPYVKAIFNEEVKPSDVIVDVGANIGVYAIPLAKKVKKVIAFEPHPRISSILERNIKLNGLRNVLLVKDAVSDSEKKILLDVSFGSDAYSKVITSDSPADSSVVSVRSVDLDTALAEENRVDWLLIDVEGHEVNVLKGAQNILRKFYPRIIIEIQPVNLAQATSLLREEGYSITRLSSFYHYARKLERADGSYVEDTNISGLQSSLRKEGS